MTGTDGEQLVPLFPQGTGDSWVEQNPTIFPNESSARWFFRQHKRRLVEEDAVALIGGRWFIDPVPWRATFRTIAAEAARRAVEMQAERAAA
jgi:hypothetical protein